MQKLPEAVRTLWRRIAVLRALITAAVVALIVLAIRQSTDVTKVIWLVPVAVFAVMAGAGIWWATVRWRSWSFDLTTRWITASRGVLTRRTVTIPRNRVQTVTTGNGPIDRYLDLTSITVHTAGAASPNLMIPHLEDSTVQWLRAELGQGVANT